MSTPQPDDRTARARIRDEALRLFADRGTDAVTVRDVAAAAGVSPALVVRHYGSKQGLIDVVDGHVAGTLEVVLAEVAAQPGGQGPSAAPGLLDAIAVHLPPDSPIPAYLSRLLLGAGGPGSALFARLYRISRQALAEMTQTGAADLGADPDVRAAFLLANDLAVLTLRSRLTEVLGVDPLSREGMARWAGEVLAVYTHGLRAPTAGT